MHAPRDPWKVIVHPHLAEKSMNMVEFQNKLTFIVRREADKKEIKEAIENLFGVKVVRVRTVITSAGVKKAYATLSKETPAGEIASRLGMV
ncbi:MAG: 50S ribosomal protein L23 [Candidatus Aenigmatarchaeota archaeon]